MTVAEIAEFGEWLINITYREPWANDGDYNPHKWDDWVEGRYYIVTGDLYSALTRHGSESVTDAEWQKMANAAARDGFGLMSEDVLEHLAQTHNITADSEPVSTTAVGLTEGGSAEVKAMSMVDIRRFGRWLAAIAQREQWAKDLDYDPLDWDDWKAGHIALVNYDVYVALQERGSEHVTTDEWQRIANATALLALGPYPEDVLAEMAKKQGLAPNGEPVFQPVAPTEEDATT